MTTQWDGYETVALVLQGGGALGAYQAGVYEALSEAGVEPNWISGTSIGAINGALIAGNAPAQRLERLREFWDTVSQPAWPLPPVWEAFPGAALPWQGTDDWRRLANQFSAARTVLAGQQGFFAPRLPPPWLVPSSTAATTSLYDPAALRATLERLVDFERLNTGEIRYSVGAVNVSTGNLTYFDSAERKIRPEHILASGALPPAFPAIEIDGEFFWDGGIVSNTPLEYVLETYPRRDTLAFQVDLWSAKGLLPESLLDVLEREKEIRYSSRTRRGTDRSARIQQLRRALHHLLARLPAELASDPNVQHLSDAACEKVLNIVHLIYRSKVYEGFAKDYEFSAVTMREHWAAGLADTRRSLTKPEFLARPTHETGVETHDIHRHDT